MRMQKIFPPLTEKYDLPGSAGRVVTVLLGSASASRTVLRKESSLKVVPQFFTKSYASGAAEEIDSKAAGTPISAAWTLQIPSRQHNIKGVKRVFFIVISITLSKWMKSLEHRCQGTTRDSCNRGILPK